MSRNVHEVMYLPFSFEILKIKFLEIPLLERGAFILSKYFSTCLSLDILNFIMFTWSCVEHRIDFTKFSYTKCDA